MSYDERDVVARIERLRIHELRLWVSEGWIRPATGERGPLFDDLDVARARLICDLRKDLSLPADAVPVVLSLLDQVHGLRRELRDFANAVDAQPGDVRAAVLQTLAALNDRRG